MEKEGVSLKVGASLKEKGLALGSGLLEGQRGTLHEIQESFLMQPVSMDKLLVDRSISWQVQQVEWQFPDAHVAYSPLLIRGG